MDIHANDDLTNGLAWYSVLYGLESLPVLGGNLNWRDELEKIMCWNVPEWDSIQGDHRRKAYDANGVEDLLERMEKESELDFIDMRMFQALYIESDRLNQQMITDQMEGHGYIEYQDKRTAQLEDEIRNSNKFAQDQEDRIAQLEAALKKADEVLKKIADEDYRGPRPHSAVEAFEARTEIKNILEGKCAEWPGSI